MKATKPSITLFSGLFPHLSTIYHDRAGETLSGFSDYNTIKVWPLLHVNRKKLTKAGKRKDDIHILGTQRIGHKIYSLHTDNILRTWHNKTGKLI